MPTLYDIDQDPEDIENTLARALQSARTNFLIGSGASLPAIPLTGDIESQINTLLAANKYTEAATMMVTFITGIQSPTSQLVAGERPSDIAETETNYREYLTILARLLIARKTELLPTQVNVFTTNYDLFIEAASEHIDTLVLNDGFRRPPSILRRPTYSSRNFFTRLTTTGHLYGYRVELPCVNLIKLHGSLSWKRDAGQILFDTTLAEPPLDGAVDSEVQGFLDDLPLVIPRQSKYQETVMDRIYYDLLRIYSNELERPTSLLVAFGFSFRDAHILEITRRADVPPELSSTQV